MSLELAIVYASLVAVEIPVVVCWVIATRRHRWPVRPGLGDMLIGGVTSFLDTLGIGNYAQITALFKLRGHPPDELIPGTLNVGNAVGIIVSAVLFTTIVRVDPVLLIAMLASAAAGAWIGAGLVSKMPTRRIQWFMGAALLIAAGFFTMTNLGIIPPTGTAMGLDGWRFVVAVAANFVLGALMCAGIGNYAPSMALLSVLGMHPIAAYPIMMASDGVLIPVASLGFLRSGLFAPAVAMGLTVGGIIGTVAAVPLVSVLADHLTVMRWVVTGVITYAAIAMLRSAMAAPVAASA
ncbi:MAG: TSUP family transporter [Proteobacteria bacterium]|nr:TSUP family transporter [Pseudomonadota bacterium]